MVMHLQDDETLGAMVYPEPGSGLTNLCPNGNFTNNTYAQYHQKLKPLLLFSIFS